MWIDPICNNEQMSSISGTSVGKLLYCEHHNNVMFYLFLMLNVCFIHIIDNKMSKQNIMMHVSQLNNDCSDI